MNRNFDFIFFISTYVLRNNYACAYGSALCKSNN